VNIQLVSTKRIRKVIVSLLMMALVFTSVCMLADTQVYAAAETITQAESISLNKAVIGTFDVYNGANKSDRKHFYKFRTASYGGADYLLQATIDQSTGGNPHLEFALLDANYNRIDADGTVSKLKLLYDNIALKGKGDTGNITYSNLKPNSTYYVEVTSKLIINNKYSNTYNFKVSKKILKPATPAVKSVKAGKNKITVKYAKVSYATKYQVQIKKAGGSWKTYNNGTKLSKVFSKLKKGKKYAVRVRAIRTVEGKTYKGAWSAKTTVKVK